jgi:hypothetical protein
MNTEDDQERFRIDTSPLQCSINSIPLPIDARTYSTPCCRLTFANIPKLNRFVKFLYGDVYPSTNIRGDVARNCPPTLLLYS